MTDVLRDGARQMLATAIEAEVEDYISDRTTAVDATVTLPPETDPA